MVRNSALLQSRCFFFSASPVAPVKVLLCNKIGKADHGDPVEGGFVAVINAANAILPPEAFQRRHHIVEEALDAVIRLIAHLKRIGHGIQNAHRLLIGPRPRH